MTGTPPRRKGRGRPRSFGLAGRSVAKATAWRLPVDRWCDPERKGSSV